MLVSAVSGHKICGPFLLFWPLTSGPNVAHWEQKVLVPGVLCGQSPCPAASQDGSLAVAIAHEAGPQADQEGTLFVAHREQE